MKRILALALALLLIALPALAEISYSEEPLADGSVLCRFEDLTIVLPADWDGKVLVREGESGLDFYQAGSYEAYQAEGLEGGGFLFMLGASVDGSFSELPSFKYLGFSEDSAMNYYMELPSDYPAYMDDDAVRAEYDAMLAQVDAIAETAVIPGNEIVEDGNDLGEAPAAADAAEAADAEDAYGGVTLAQLRYHFEHSALPRYFYEAPDNMLDVLDRVGAYALFTSLADENGVAYDYSDEDFAQALYASADGTLLLQLDLPQPENTPDCYRIYMLYDPDTQAAAYYTLEYDAMAVELGGPQDALSESAFLCGWDAEGTHGNYGGVNVPRKGIDGYDDALYAEAEGLAEFAGVDPELTPFEFGDSAQ